MSAVSLKPLTVLALAGTALLAGCTPAADPAPAAAAAAPAATTAAAEPATPISRTARLQAFLAQRYGQGAALSGDWRGSWTQDGETRPVSWQVCAEQPVVSGDSWQQLLAVCGALVEAGHPEPGTIDFYVLRPTASGFDVAAELTGGTYGSSGQPGTVQIVRAGSDFYGFRVEDGWFGQGYSLISQSLVLPGPKGLVDTGSMRSHIDNGAAYDCDDADAAEDCRSKVFNIDFNQRFDDSDRSARVWPLLVEETGSTCGGTAVRQQHRFTLDPKTWTYSFPAALLREGCE
ncbi:hypothetical protein [Stenotrophomonas sp. SAU14A_NAIMI4_8]|uniref:hypothetical protein n=1 Tax=Stenotrophomonas sp. SAU14A_NAIMI4_8 TaxID=2072409 RepID=UPI000D53E886|nr:hypothetical protein [Stenotrophomonas sp. SAU14A_NAIMI4_8]AWH34656.1 hypothetical protein C1930_18105 [Stenotrophomonas sp. SAU14A_NAIMI4_8]